MKDAPKVHAFDIQPAKLGSALPYQCSERKASGLLRNILKSVLLRRVSTNRPRDQPRVGESTHDVSMPEGLAFQERETSRDAD